MLIHLPSNQLTERIVGCGLEVHRRTGPGLLEGTCPCLAFELQNAGMRVAAEVPLATTDKGLQMPCAYRLDLVVDEQVVVEVKAVERLLPVHAAQLLTYLRLGNYSVGLLFNFNETLFKNGIVRVLNEQYVPENS